jgi:hypothetical protein
MEQNSWILGYLIQTWFPGQRLSCHGYQYNLWENDMLIDSNKFIFNNRLLGFTTLIC